MSDSSFMDLLQASAVPLDADVLQLMLKKVEDTECMSFWDRVSQEDGPQSVAWKVSYGGEEYILVQQPDDTLIALQGVFWLEALGFSREEDSMQPEDERPAFVTIVAPPIGQAVDMTEITVADLESNG